MLSLSLQITSYAEWPFRTHMMHFSQLTLLNQQNICCCTWHMDVISFLLPYAVITNEISCFNVIAWKGYKRYLSKSVACGTSCSIVSTIFDDATNNGVGGSMNNCSPSNLPQKVHAQHLRHNQQTISRVTRNHDQCLSHVVMCLSVFFFSFFESGKSSHLLGGAS